MLSCINLLLIIIVKERSSFYDDEVYCFISYLYSMLFSEKELSNFVLFPKACKRVGKKKPSVTTLLIFEKKSKNYTKIRP